MRKVLGPFAYLKSKKNQLLSALGVYPKIYSGDFHDHITIVQLKDLLPRKIFESYFKFAFVRNPWDWQVSLYHFAKQNKNHHQHDLISNMSFEEYIDWRVHDDLHLQMEFVCDKEGQLLVDFIGKLENLENDFRNVCTEVKISDVMNLPKLNTSEHRSYKRYYDNHSKNLIAEAFKKDIELFDYTF